MNRKSQLDSEIARNLPSHPGKRARLWRLLYGHGPGNGSLMVLPLDQGLEHGPTDFFPHPPALDPDYQFRLAVEGRTVRRHERDVELRMCVCHPYAATTSDSRAFSTASSIVPTM